MSGIYQFTKTQLSAALAAAGGRGLYGFADLEPAGQTREEPEEGLRLLLAAAQKPDGCFTMEDVRDPEQEQKTVVYFREDIIAVVEQKGEAFELLWIPYLPLAIGEVANLHEPYLNPSSRLIREEAQSAGTEWIDAYLKKGYVWQWEMWGERPGQEEKPCSLAVLSDGKEQLMILEKDGLRRAICPDKTDYVNQITEILAGLYSESLRKMQEKEG